MKGFELQHNNETISASLEKGVVSIIIISSNGSVNLYFGGLDRGSDKHIKWFDANIQKNYEVKIKIVDITENSVPVEIRSANMPNIDLRLGKYLSLKKKLTEKGVI